MPTVRLKPGHVQPVWAGHPWVYGQAIERIDGGAVAGDEVDVIDPRENLLGRGFYTPGSAIPVRILVRDKTTRIDAGFFRARIEQAIAHRAAVGLDLAAPKPTKGTAVRATNGFRLVHAEGDGLPGLIVDRFDDVLVVQFSSFGMKMREALVLEALDRLVRPRAIIERSSANAAKNEGFTATNGVVRGEDVRELGFVERGLAYRLPLELGQKTGFYFDQRALRGRIEELASGRRVLDAYSYVGAFSLAAARGGASEVVAVDESGLALEVGAECARANGLAGRIRYHREDARKALQDARASYDLVIADPPRLAPTKRSREGALVAYAKLAEGACRAVRPGGFVVVCSCSAAVDLGSLTRALAMGALHANVRAVVLERHFQGADHPVPAAFPEGLYLKALVARVEAR